MGGAASVGSAKPLPASTVFLSPDLTSLVQRLRGDEKLLHSFLDYVKSGAWQDRLARFVPKESIAADENENEKIHAATAEDLFGRYGLGRESVLALFPSTSFRRIAAESRVDTSVSMRSQHSTCFSSKELCCLMFLIVLPYFAEVNSKNRFHRSTHQRDDESSVGSRSVDAHLVPSPESIRAENILHSCATHFDGEEMLAYMRQDWVAFGVGALDNHALSIAIVDTAKIDQSYVYCNEKFAVTFEYKRGELTGQPITALKGRETEPAQWDSLMQSFKTPPHHVTRTWVTLSTKYKRSVLDLVAVAMVGTYAVTVHFAASPASKPVWAQLEMVDDLLLLLTYVVIPPPPSWFAISSTLANRVANALPSPLSRRSNNSSTTTSGRQGSQSGERHSGRVPGRMLARGQGSISSIGSAGSGSIAWVGQLGGLRSPVSGGGSVNAAVPEEDEFNQVVPM